MTFEQFLNSENKARLIKFFLYNNSAPSHHISDIARQLGLTARTIRGDLLKLIDGGFVKSRSAQHFSVNGKFPYLDELRELVLKFPPVPDGTIIKEAQKIGAVKLLIVAGVFLNAQKSRADLIVVGDKISEKKFARFMRSLECGVGREVHYVLMSASEFKYRKEMFDRFILDVLEFPHRKLINKLKI